MIEHKRWMVLPASSIAVNSHATPEEANRAAEKAAADQIGGQFVVLETQHYYEATARVSHHDLYRDWDADKILPVPAGLEVVEAPPVAPAAELSPEDECPL